MLENVKQILDRYPIEKLYDGPSAINRLTNLEKLFDSAYEIYIKRDDQLRPLFGNKLRYIEFLFGYYRTTNHDCIVHAGGLTSNYMAQLAMAGALCNIPVYILINGPEPEYVQGNTLLEKIFAKELHFIQSDELTNTTIKEQFADNLRKEGFNPLVIDYPLGNFFAHLGYVKAYYELQTQIRNESLPDFDHIFICSGFHSYLGLKIAADLSKDPVRITAFRASRWAETNLRKIYPDMNDFLKDKVREFGDFLKIPLKSSAFDMTDDFAGPQYAVADSQTYDTLMLLAKTEGILLDPVYTAKAFNGMISTLKQGAVNSGSKVLFFHTGGLINNFSYAQHFTDYLNTQSS